jgi:hypothetical protein
MVNLLTIEDPDARIVEMELGDVVEQIENFNGHFPLDFSHEFLIEQGDCWLRHTLSGVIRQEKTHC